MLKDMVKMYSGPIEEGRVRQGGGVRQLKTADQSVWAESRASTTLLYRPDFAHTDRSAVFNWRRIVFHTPSCHTLYIK